ncbi:MAG: DUF885 domain-containing protein [Opitutales bacterium]
MNSRTLLAGVVLGAVLIVPLMASSSPAPAATATARANAFFERAFDESLARSPMGQTQLGLKQDYDKWDDFSEEAAAENLALTVRQLAELKRTINYAALDEPARVSYRMFASQAEQAIEGWRWRYHSYLFDQMNGLQSVIPAFLISYHTVDNASDARAYVARLRGIAPMFDQLIAGAKLRQQKGILPPKFVFPLVIAACRSVVAGEPFDAKNGKNSLLDDFEKKVGALKDIDAAAKTALVAQARAALLESVGPAYGKLIALLEEQEKSATDEDGVWKLPAGREYYDYCLRVQTTTNLTADEIHELGLREVERIHHEMEAIRAKVGFRGDLTAFFKFIKEDPQFYYPTTPEGKAAYIKRASAIIDEMRGRLDEFFRVKPKAPLVVREVEPFRQEGSPSAFYEQGSPDGSRPGTYYVNTLDMHGLPIFEMETLAHHEAIPGHHMQISIAQELENMPRFRKFSSGYNAYVEGWALYCEYFPKEFGFYSDPYMDFGRLNDELLRAVRLVVDTGIHAKHWTRRQVVDYFRANTPNPERDIFTETNRYIVWPGQACAYKVGSRKILELRELARKELGPKFDLRGFHDLVLQDGAVPLDLLEENVKAWIAAKK